MAVVSIPHCDPWVVNRWAFSTLMERARCYLDEEDDDPALTRAVALDGLHFDLLHGAQRLRLALVLERAADELRSEHREKPESRDRDFADRLDVLRLSLSDLTESETEG